MKALLLCLLGAGVLITLAFALGNRTRVPGYDDDDPYGDI